jgi:3,4-dihydroxy 2-butanone 4-phosphate synthase/GTP cyclohydrolase II
MSIERIIEEAKNGKMFILCDDEGRENEGDLIIPAQFATPQMINFMITHGRGLVFMAITEEKRVKMELKMMVEENKAKFGTAFTVSIGSASGITTGISPFDRSHTILTFANPNAKPEDIVCPGHVFPVVAHKGGISARQGHTEASIEICKRAGLEAVAVGCEIINEDGTMARRPQLDIFAKKHGLNIGFISDLI